MGILGKNDGGGTSINIPPVKAFFAFFLGFAIIYFAGIAFISTMLISISGIFSAMSTMLVGSFVVFILILLLLFFWKYFALFKIFLIGIFAGGIFIFFQIYVYDAWSVIGAGISGAL